MKLALSMNKASNRNLETIKSLYNKLGLFNIEDQTLISNSNKTITIPISDQFLSGIIDGDGSFFISFQQNGEIKTGFNITSDLDSKSLLEGIQIKLQNIGSIHKGTKNELDYSVTGLNQINNILIPFVDINPIFSERALHYNKFKIVSKILKSENPLSLQTKLDIVELAYNMNKKGKHRTLSKSQYIEILSCTTN